MKEVFGAVFFTDVIVHGVLVFVPAARIPELVLEYAIAGVAQSSVPMARTQGTFRFTALMTGSVALGDVITYRIVATDGASPPNVISNPGAGWNHFLIEQENRVLVIELDESPDSGALLVDVCDDLGLTDVARGTDLLVEVDTRVQGVDRDPGFNGALQGRREKMFLGYSSGDIEIRNEDYRTADAMMRSIEKGLRSAGTYYVDLRRVTCREQSS